VVRGFGRREGFRKFKKWLPDDTVKAATDFRVSIKGPLTTPVGGGIRSLNVALRQLMDLYAVRAAGEVLRGRAQPGEASGEAGRGDLPREHGGRVCGDRVREGTAEAKKLIAFVNDEMLKGGKKRVRLDSGVGIKPISITGTKRLVRAAIRFALKEGRKTVTLVHKGNIQKFTEGAFREWGYEVAVEEFRAEW
jgi:isocitrate dehydrogenase